jgi:CRP-like cAMP-binding protein
MAAKANIRKLLAQVPHFQRGCFEAIDATAACFRLREVKANESVLSIGSPGDALFFILTGDFEAHLANNQSVTMHPGDFFGEIGLLLGVHRTSSVTARTDGSLLVLPGEHLGRILRVFPQLKKDMEQKALARAPELMQKIGDAAGPMF